MSGTTETISYLGVTEAVLRISTAGGNTDAALTAKGDRTAVKVGSATRFTLPDLHGNTAVSISAADGTTTEALRYDGYGVLLDAWPGSGVPSAHARWRYQGNLDVSPSSAALYENGFRFYSPGLGTFTGFDTLIGQAENPISTNRYLYAGASPWTLTDPTGHFFENLTFDPLAVVGAVASTAVGIAAGVAVTAAASTIGVAAVAAGAVGGAAASIATDVVSGRGVRLESALSGAAAGAVGVATFGVALAATRNVAVAATTAGAVAGATGNAVSQGIEYVATGGESGFSIEEVALSAGLGAVGGWAGQKVADRAMDAITSWVGRGADRGLKGLTADDGPRVDDVTPVQTRGRRGAPETRDQLDLVRDELPTSAPRK